MGMGKSKRNALEEKKTERENEREMKKGTRAETIIFINIPEPASQKTKKERKETKPAGVVGALRKERRMFKSLFHFGRPVPGDDGTLIILWRTHTLADW